MLNAAPGVRWVVEATSLAVYNPSGSVTRLGYPEAAVWDMLTHGETPTRAAGRLVYVAALSPIDAEAVVGRAVDAWVRAGLFVRS